MAYNTNRRVVITGLGAVTPIGNTAEEFWANLIAGKSGIGYITRFDTTNSNVKIAGQVKNFNPDEYIDPKAARRMARFSQYGVAVARQAVADSGYVITEENSDDVAVMMATGGGGLDIMQDASVIIRDKGMKCFDN